MGKAYGMADIEEKRPANSKTLYQVKTILLIAELIFG